MLLNLRRHIAKGLRSFIVTKGAPRQTVKKHSNVHEESTQLAIQDTEELTGAADLVVSIAKVEGGCLQSRRA